MKTRGNRLGNKLIMSCIIKSISDVYKLSEWDIKLADL